MNFANNLTKLLELNHLNYEQVAAGTGFSSRAVSYWAQGKRIPNITNAQKVADYFGVSLDSMMK